MARHWQCWVLSRPTNTQNLKIFLCGRLTGADRKNKRLQQEREQAEKMSAKPEPDVDEGPKKFATSIKSDVVATLGAQAEEVDNTSVPSVPNRSICTDRKSNGRSSRQGTPD